MEKRLLQSPPSFSAVHVPLQRDRRHIEVRLKSLAVFHLFGRLAIVVPNDLHLKGLLGTKQTTENENQH